MKVRDVMTADAVTVRTDTPFRTLVEIIEERGISGLPVIDEMGRVLGMVTSGDLVVKGHRAHHVHIHTPTASADEVGEHDRRAQGTCAGALMTTPAVTIDADADVRSAARLMTLHGIRRVAVTTEGVLVGMLTRGDVLKVFLRPDEDIEWEIKHHLARVHADVPELEVSVVAGVVRLAGNVRRRSVANLIAFHADRCDGVVRVDDELVFDIDDLEPVTVSPPAVGPLEQVL